VWSVESQPTFRRNMSTSSGSKNKRSKKPACKQVVSRACCHSYSSTLNMEAIRSSETSVGFQQTKRRYMPEDRTVQV
jgi:hypothetical protein